jgi:hypothetical protein
MPRTARAVLVLTAACLLGAAFAGRVDETGAAPASSTAGRTAGL